MGKNDEWLRKAAVAGRFYPNKKAPLENLLADYLAGPPKEKFRATAVFAPHAGYIYSGKIAGDIYKQITVPDSCIVLCPNHTGDGPPISVWAKGEWETPMGKVAVDESLAAAIIAETGGKAQADRNAHLYEHAIEVHLPFLLTANPKVKVVPIVLGRLFVEDVLTLGELLASVVEAAGREILIVASTDMSHYISGDEAKVQDRPALDAIERLDPAGLYQAVVENDISMCGFIPTATALAAAKRLGSTQARVISYGNSGDASGDYKRVVAYASGFIR